MHEHTSRNNKIVAAADATIPAPSSAALDGKAVFTTVAIYRSQPFLWEKHWLRLCGDAAKLAIDISDYSESSVQGSLLATIEANNVTNGRARITLFDESSGGFWPYENRRRSSLLIMTADLRETPKNLRLAISPYRVNSASPLAGVKSCNYLEKVEALGEARNRGFDEAIQLNEYGHITSACMANIFWLKDGSLYTPGLKTGCMAGTMREFLMENLDCVEIEAGLGPLPGARAIYLTSAGIGIVSVSEFEGRKFDGSDHKILDLLEGK